MKKLYDVTITYGYSGNNSKQLKVVAKTPRQVVDLCEKYAKKNYWNEARISYICEQYDVQLVQK